jgi:hypothetical protein
MIVGAVRPDSWNLPLFLHVFGAMILFGALASAAITARASGRIALPQSLLFRIFLLVAVPSWLVMRLAGQWIDSKEDIQGDPRWLGIGFGVSDAGAVVLLAATLIAWWGTRRPDLRWPRQAAGVIAFLYLLALGYAWWAMTTKPGA